MKKITFFTISTSLFLCFSINKMVAQEVDHKDWGVLLNTYVTDEGSVSYAEFDKKALQNYLKTLQENTPNAKFSSNEKLAYWINAYNAYTVKLILEHYPLKSIKDISNPWDIKFIPYKGENISLNHIEHEILRKLGDPRIHFAINCASISCPKLLNDAFYSDRIDSQLDNVTKGFINNRDKNILSEDPIKISQLFNWFRQDFEQNNESLISFINKYSSVKVKEDASINFAKYNWDLNN